MPKIVDHDERRERIVEMIQKTESAYVPAAAFAKVERPVPVAAVVAPAVVSMAATAPRTAVRRSTEWITQFRASDVTTVP